MAIKASNQITLIDLTDGYSVVLTNESHTFLGTTNSVSGTQTTTTMIQALCGSEVVPCSVGTISAPTGLSIVSDGKTPTPTLTITATSALTQSGSVIIPVTVNNGDITISKTFSYSIAFKGSAGTNGTNGTSVTVSSTSVTYQTSSSGTTTPTGTWNSTIPSTSAGQYLWTKTVVTYSDGKSTTSYSVSRNGSNGSNGADALSMVIISSNGSIFKNTNIATTLSAHVYKGSAEVTGSALTALGTIKWYKDGGTTAVATGTNLTINPGDVSNNANYVAQLEG